MNKNSPQEKMPYLNDGEIYNLWKYLNSFRLEKENRITFNDLIALNQENLFVLDFSDQLYKIGIDDLKDLDFHKDSYLEYNKNKYNKLIEEPEEKEIKKYNLDPGKHLKKIFSGNFNLDDVVTFSVFYEDRLEALGFFEFSSELLPNNKKKLANFVNPYIKHFINDNLKKDRHNFYHFDKQRKEFFKNLSNYEKEYGKNFIIEYPKILDIELDTEYLFIHTLIALEELHYFEIEKIWILDIFLHPDENVESYKVKINLKDKFFDEKNKIIYKNDFKNPAKKIENQKKELSFKDDKSTLSFDNKEIIISKTRNSNGHYLLKTIFKNKNKIWEYDEIAEDWTDEYKKSDWSRYYNAGYKVNEKVAKETTIKDFLVITNKTVCINKKYL